LRLSQQPLSVTVSTGGAQSEILTLEYPALSKAGVYQVMKAQPGSM
jgi:hypothetical protein